MAPDEILKLPLMERRYLAIRDTADQAGRLQDHPDAMSEYRSAARLGSWGEAAQEGGKDLLNRTPWIGAAYAIARKYMP